MTYTYNTKGVCSSEISFDIDSENKVHNIRFRGGCNGNTTGISILAEGKDANELVDLLLGTTCGFRSTSCPDQLARAIKEALGKRD